MENTLQKFRTENKDKLDDCLRFLAAYSGFNNDIESTKFEGDVVEASTFSVRYSDGSMVWINVDSVDDENTEEIQEATE